MNTTTAETEEWIKNVGLYAAIENATAHMRKLELQRDNLQKTVDGLCEHFGITPPNSTLLVVELLRMKREVGRQETTAKYKDDFFLALKERDEVRYKAERYRIDANAMMMQRDEAREQIERLSVILSDILAFNVGEKPHDYWALPNRAQANTMAFDAWQEILNKIEKALENKP